MNASCLSDVRSTGGSVGLDINQSSEQLVALIIDGSAGWLSGEEETEVVCPSQERFFFGNESGPEPRMIGALWRRCEVSDPFFPSFLGPQGNKMLLLPQGNNT